MVETGATLRHVPLDLSDLATLDASVAAIRAAGGGRRIDLLVNNAGVLERQMRLDEMDVRRWTRVLTTNVIGSFVCAREAVRRMSTRHGGHGGAIVNVSSMAAVIGGAQRGPVDRRSGHLCLRARP